MGLMAAGYILEARYREVERYNGPIAMVVLAAKLLTYIWRLIAFQTTPR